jgi:hypothetical protein
MRTDRNRSTVLALVIGTTGTQMIGAADKHKHFALYSYLQLQCSCVSVVAKLQSDDVQHVIRITQGLDNVQH